MRLLSVDIETTGLLYTSDILTVAATHNFNGVLESIAWPVKAYDLYHQPTEAEQVYVELGKLIDQADYSTMLHLTWRIYSEMGLCFRVN